MPRTCGLAPTIFLENAAAPAARHAQGAKITPAGGGDPAGVIIMIGNWEEECCQSYRRDAGRRSASLRIPVELRFRSIGSEASCRAFDQFAPVHPSPRGRLTFGLDHL